MAFGTEMTDIAPPPPSGGCSDNSTRRGRDEDSRFVDRLRPETRHTLNESSRILKEAARIRNTTVEAEEDLLRWEARVRAERPIGTRWAEELEEAKALVAKISLKLVTDVERQREALCHFRAAHASIRSAAARDRLGVPERALAAFARSEKLRAEAVEAAQLALDQSEQVLSAEARKGPPEVLPLLARRRRLFSDSLTLLRTAFNAEVEAFTAADQGISQLEWDVKELQKEVERLRKEKKACERRIQYLEKARTELARARDEALAIIQTEREEKSRLVAELEKKTKRPDGRLSLRIAPAARFPRPD